MKKKSKVLLVLSLFLLTAFYTAFKINFPYDVKTVLAGESSERSESSSSGEDEYEIIKEERIIILEPEKVIYETKVQSVTLIDSDKDGIADEYDPHPNLAEIYIVADDDKNGIVDIFESLFEKQ